MALELQASLLDLVDEPGIGPLGKVRRRPLSGGAWVDVLPGWLTGADALFDHLVARVHGGPSAGTCTTAWSTCPGY